MPRIRKPDKPPAISNAAQSAIDALEGGEIVEAPESVEGESSNVSLGVVKMKLSTFCPNKQIRTKLNAMVHELNILVAEAYKFANLHITRLLNERKELPIIDRNFYYRCLLATSENNCRKDTLGADIEASVVMFDALRPPEEAKISVVEYNQVVAGLSITMATMADNHLWMNLEPRLKRYMSWKYPEIKKHVNLVVKALVNRPKARVDEVVAHKKRGVPVDAKMARAREVAEELRGVMRLPSALQSKTRSRLTLPLYHKILTETGLAKAEAHAQQQRFRGRTFSLLPNKSGYTAGYIPISSMSMLAMLKRLGLEKFDGDGRDEDALEVWRKHFNLNAAETENARFGGSIVTDGCGVSVVLDKKTCLCATQCEVDRARLLELFKAGARSVGVDPGFTDVVTLATRDGQVSSYSSKQYYERAMYNLSRRRTDKWNAETKDIVEGIPTCETTDMDRLQTHIGAYLASLRYLIGHRLQKGYRNMRFMRYCGKKQAIREICLFIAPDGVPTIVGFGNWNGGAGTPISRRCAGPVQQIKLELMNMDNVVFVNIPEKRTSQTCHHCLQKLTNMRAKSMVYNKRERRMDARDVTKIHKVLHCKSSNGGHESRCGTTWNRDANAAKNILMLTMYEVLGFERPAVFC